VYDRDDARLSQFVKYYNVLSYPSLENLLADSTIELVLNLTTPENHYAVTRACLEAGKHVYSEKPLAMNMDDANALVSLAKFLNLTLSAAPSSVLGEAAKAVSEAISAGRIGKVKLVYAEMEDGPVFLDKWREWRSVSGAIWPGEHEFGIGCTLEHAGYYLTWLCALFGPVTEVSAFATTLFPDKNLSKNPEKPHKIANDLSIACLKFESGVIARLTTGLAAPRDRSMQIIGETGVICVADGWDVNSPVHIRRNGHGRAERSIFRVLHRLEPWVNTWITGRIWFGEKIRFRKTAAKVPAYPSRMDFMRGPAAQARAIRAGGESQLSAAFALHITELALALQYADQRQQPMRMTSRF
jgi:predicted dehydrogenase